MNVRGFLALLQVAVYAQSITLAAVFLIVRSSFCCAIGCLVLYSW